MAIRADRLGVRQDQVDIHGRVTSPSFLNELLEDLPEWTDMPVWINGTEELLPSNNSVPVTSPILADIAYPDIRRDNQYFTHRESPTSVDGLAKIKSIKGNTIVWNQLVPLNAIRASGEVTPNRGLSYTNNNDGSITLSGTATENGIASFYFIADNVLPCIQGHKYLTDANNRIYGSGTITDSGHGFTATSNEYMRLWARIPVVANTVYNLTYYPQIYDLTVMFGETLANAIYAMEQSQSNAGVAYLNSLFPLPYYAYNQGSLLSFNGNGIKTVGKNQLDTSVFNEVSSYTVNNDGSLTVNSSDPRAWSTISAFHLKKGNYIFTRSVPNGVCDIRFEYEDFATNHLVANQLASYPFTVTQDTDVKIKVGYSYSSYPFTTNVMIRFADANDTFEPYTSSTLSLPISTYFPNGMKSAGTVYDELTPRKAITRIGAVDLGTLNWTYNANYGMYTGGLTDVIKKPSTAQTKANVLCANRKTATWSQVFGGGKESGLCGVADTGHFGYSTTETDPSTFKQSMNGVYLYYELATPVELPTMSFE